MGSILVLGGTGPLGEPVAWRLQADGLVRAERILGAPTTTLDAWLEVRAGEGGPTGPG